MTVTEALTQQVEVTVVNAPTLNFAMDQSGMPLIRDVLIRNPGPDALRQASLQLQLLPDLADPLLMALPDISPGEELTLGVIDYRLPAGRLRGVIEAERAQLAWKLTRGTEVLLGGASDVDVLAFNEWPGLRGPAGQLASFVMPNHPALVSLLHAVRERLGETTGDNALDGYQSRSPERVGAMLQALYRTVQDSGLSYVGVPASFEIHGQKVRLPDMLLRDGMGCCLDVTLLFAACLERMGLHPLTILVEGHAFPALWLLEERFPEGIIEDAARLRNAIALGHLVAFDSSTVLAASSPSLGQAVAVANASLDDDSRFHYALDIPVMRRAGFLPLALRETVEAAEPERDWVPVTPPMSPSMSPSGSQADSGTPAKPPVAGPPEEVASRFQRWQEKLLDLSLRNKLLNFNLSSKAAVALGVPDIAGLEDQLAEGKAIAILPPPVLRGLDERDPSLAMKRVPAAELQAMLLDDLKSGIIRSPLSEAPLLAALKNLERTSRSDFEEGGAPTLYLAIGLLKWFETPTSGKERFAPLLLYPVSLEFDRAKRLYRLRRQPEEPMANVTLVEKLKRDFGVDLSALLTLEADDSGLDVPRLLQASRLAIQRMPRWEVLDQAHLGLFSFTKFLMWKDLSDNAEILLESEVVRHVASRENHAFAQQVADVPAERLDADVPAERLDSELAPERVPCVVDADSTQMSAIASALAGRSFVLQGPPGTGKSQTITNLIAALLAQGQKVLFVSEKMAALDVVHRRLSEVGLGDFCLELHSHKSNKKQVMDSLAQVLNRAATVSQVPWESRSQELAQLQAQLNALAQALHRTQPLGPTFHQALDRLVALADAPEVRFPIPAVAELSADRYRDWQARVTEFAERAATVEPFQSHPWAIIRTEAWSARFQEEVSDALERLLRALAEVDARLPELEGLTEVPMAGSSESLRRWTTFLARLGEGPIPALVLEGSAWPEVSRRAQAYLSAQRSHDRKVEGLLSRWKPHFLELDTAPLTERFQEAAMSFPLLSFFKLWGPKRLLKLHAEGALADDATLLADLLLQSTLRSALPELTGERGGLADRLGSVWRPEDALDALEAMIARADHVHAAAQDLGSPGGWGRIPAMAKAGGSDDRLEAARRNLEVALDELEDAETSLSSLLAIPLGKAWPSRSAERHREGLREAVLRWLDQMPKFRAMCLYREAAASLVTEGLEPLVEAHERGSSTADALLLAFERNVLKRWTTAVRDQNEALLRFDGPSHERTIARFAKLDAEYLLLARQWVVANLEQRLPSLQGPMADSSEPGILQREMKKKARHLPVRKLLQAIPNLVFRLKPCFMMSPMSIAQYLPADAPRFDVVVFDEASQIGTHDAIGAIARGARVIVVGDSKQLPPTTFFQRQTEDEGVPDENDVVELESILDEMTAKQLPQQMLGWHYRSRHDSLIDFSNRHYYEGKLHIFPSASRAVEGLGVSWHPVPGGVYMGASATGSGDDARSAGSRSVGDRSSGSRSAGAQAGTNPEEATALVEHLVEVLRRTDPSRRTFGVVTFNMAQQALILDLLDEARARLPEIEPHFVSGEPVFVKNLENVQGDERDEIYFSICYAKDASGKLRMHFGPLSMSGGERRLNVAITRARCQLKVFSTLTYDQIDLSRTNAVGTTHLRRFLQFVARQGGDERLSVARNRQPQGAFEREIRETLEALGYEVHSQIGSGDYRIDLAVVHPEKPGVYVLGLETDGPNYGSGKTARDRDRLRRQVLGGLGWQLRRLWALEWRQDPVAQRETLRAWVEEALERARSTPQAELPRIDPQAAPLTPELPEPEPRRLAVGPSLPVPPRPFEGRPYVSHVLPLLSADQEAFYAPAASPAIRLHLRRLVEVEGPIHLDLAARKLMAGWSLGRLTDRVRRRVADEVSAVAGSGTVVREGDFLWPAGLKPGELATFRKPEEGGVSRDAEAIAPEEVAIAAAWVLSNCLSLDREEAVREVAKCLGLLRVGKNVAQAMERGIDLLAARGQCVSEGTMLKWLG